MDVDINNFLAVLSDLGGLASPNHLLVTFTLPSIVGDTKKAEQLSLLCDGAPLPGVQIATVDGSQPYGFGPQYKMPYGVIFTDTAFSFYLDNKGVIHSILTGWLNSIVRFKSQQISGANSGPQPFFVSYRDTYTVDISIQYLDPKADKIIEYTLYNAFPISLDDFQGDWGADNSYIKLGARFTFTHWNSEYFAVSAEDKAVISSYDKIAYDSVNKTSFAQVKDSLYPQYIADILNDGANAMVARATSSAASSLVNGYKRVIATLGSGDLRF